MWNGWKAQLLRTLYYETEPVLTGGFSEVNRAQRVAIAQAEFRAELKDWTPAEIDAYIARHYPGLLAQGRSAAEDRACALPALRPQQAGKSLATTVASIPAARGVTELTVLAPDHPRLLSIIAGACAVAGANIVDAQIFTTTDGRALDTISVSREFERDDGRGAPRRAHRRCDREGAARRPAAAGGGRQARERRRRGSRPSPSSPRSPSTTSWSNRYTVVEVTGLDRPGLLYELTATLSKLNLNIASAHVATFGERVVDVFYVTDLFGAKITSATRQAAIKRALIGLLSPNHEPSAKPAKTAAAVG